MLLMAKKAPLTVYRGFLRRYLSISTGFPGDKTSGFSSQLYALLSQDKKSLMKGEESRQEALSSARRDLVNSVGLSSHQEGVAPETIAKKLISHYKSLTDSGKKQAFFSVLAGDLEVNHKEVWHRAQQLNALHSQDRNEATMILKSESNLRLSLTPFYCHLFTVIARVEEGIKFLVDIRRDLLALTQELQSIGSPDPHLTEIAHHLKDILSQWFTPQLLELCHVTWQSPCDLLEKISSYEAVHPLRHWKDLKHRLGTNRRCFVFMHKAIPREPIMILHVALTKDPASNIDVLLDRGIVESESNISTANFYSISATQKGLSGVELGNFLISRVVQKLQGEFPQDLKKFVTLSPIPGFKQWLDTHIKLSNEQGDFGVPMSEVEPLLDHFPEYSSPLEALMKALEDPIVWKPGNTGGARLEKTLQSPLTKLCARYLAVVKRRGHAIDPVANFHLQNGASIGRLNWMGDPSFKGMRRSYGLMVNYHYNLPDISKNSDVYRLTGKIALSDSVQQWLT